MLPGATAKEQGHKFRAGVVRLGPNEGWRIVELKVFSTGRTDGVRVQLRHDWKDFSLDYGFNESDVLLFSLVGLTKFVVQVFRQAKCFE